MKRKSDAKSSTLTPATKIKKFFTNEELEYIKTCQLAAEQRVLRKDYYGAALTIKKAINMLPHDPRAYFEGALLSMHSENYLNLHRMCTCITQCTPQNQYWSNMAKGILAEETEDVEKAEQFYNAARSCSDATDNLFRATLYMGSVQRQKGNAIEAIDWYYKAYRIQLDLPDRHEYLLSACMWNIADTYHALGDIENTTKYLEESIKICPEYIDIYFDRIRDALFANEDTLAMICCEYLYKVVKEGKLLSDVHYWMARCQTEREDSIKYLEQAIKLNPQYFNAHEMLICSVIQIDQISKAQNLIQEAMHIFVDDPPSMIWLQRMKLFITFGKKEQTEEREPNWYIKAYSDGLLRRIS